MGHNAIQFQKGLSVPEFLQLYGTESQCVRKLWLRSAGLTAFNALAAVGLSMASCTAEDSSVTNAGNAGTRPL